VDFGERGWLMREALERGRRDLDLDPQASRRVHRLDG
jgi:hypothetical protein